MDVCLPRMFKKDCSPELKEWAENPKKYANLIMGFLGCERDDGNSSRSLSATVGVLLLSMVLPVFARNML